MALTKAQQKEKEEAIERLREMLPPGSTVYTGLDHVSRSGMFRVISCYVARDNEIQDITWLVARAIEYKRDLNRGGLRVSGCGMDMGFHVVYTLSSVLYRGGFECIGDGGGDRSKYCPSNDHSNGDRNYEPHQHSDGGYALTRRWL